MSLTLDKITGIFEGALYAAGTPLSLKQILTLFEEDEMPSKEQCIEAIQTLMTRYENSTLELKELASGYQFQVRAEFAPWVNKLWDEKPARYTRATLETLALIAYRQPITRGEIEEVRGVAVSTQTIKSLMEREWVRVVGQRDVPGKPSLYATTKQFLDYFNLKSLDELPPLTELRDLDKIAEQLEDAQQEVKIEETAEEVEEHHHHEHPELEVVEG